VLILERPWTSQPQGAVELDYQLLGRQAVAAVINMGVPKGVSKSAFPIESPVIAASGFGLVLSSSLNYGTTSNKPSIAVPCTARYQDPHTIFVRYKPKSINTDSVGIGITGFCVASRPYLSGSGLYIGQNNANALFFSRRYLRATISSVFVADESIVLALHAPGQSSIRMFVNGSFNSFLNVDNDTSGSFLVCGAGVQVDATGNTASPPGELEMVLALAGSASDAEVERVSRVVMRDPWSIVKSRRIYIPTATAAGGAPTLSDLQAVSITSTSVQATVDYAF
jgi:hypothetical protein